MQQQGIPIHGPEFPHFSPAPWVYSGEYDFPYPSYIPSPYYSPAPLDNYLNDAGFGYHPYDAGFDYNLNDAGFGYNLNNPGFYYNLYDAAGLNYEIYDAGLDYYNLYDPGFCYNWSGVVCESPMASYWRQIHHQQLLLHQDLMYRHQTTISHLCGVTNQLQALRYENANLKKANRYLNDSVESLLKTTSSSRGVSLGWGFDGMSKMGAGADDEGSSVKDEVPMSPTPACILDPLRVGVERVNLPRSISVRSSDYLKAGKRRGNIRASNPPTQKVYVRASENEEAVEVEVYEQGMFKTELCNKWQQTGSCSYGENCRFAHDIEELRPIIRHPRYKTKLCLMLLNESPCRYGFRCHFRHVLNEEEKNLVRAPTNTPVPTEPMN